MNPHIINYSFSSSTATSVLPIPSIDIDCGTCRQACLDQLCVLLDDGWIPAQPIHPSIQTVQYRGVVVVVYTMANDAAAEREIPFVVCNCCAHRLPENVTGILIFNRHSAFVHPIRSYVFAHSRALPGLDWTGLDGRSTGDGQTDCAHVGNGRGRTNGRTDGTTEPSANHWVMDCFAISTTAALKMTPRQSGRGRGRGRGKSASPRMYRLNSS